MKNNNKLLMLLAFVAFAFVACDEDSPTIRANWSFTPEENIQAGDTVYFTNTSSADVEVEYEWEFGDGNTSSEESPWHIYSEPGIFDVSLNVVYGSSSKISGQQINVGVDYSYIINYGSYSGGKSTVTAYNPYDNQVVNGYYNTINEIDMVSNVQYACPYKGNIYLMNNNADGISWVNAKTFKQTNNAVTDDFIKPRYCIGYGDYLYVACYGGDVWADNSLGYIAKFNLNTKSVDKIDLPGGPEGMAIVGDKLYVALRYGKKIAIVDLVTETTSTMDVSGQPVFFRKDPQNNLYVSITRNWDDTDTQTGIAYMNTSTNTLGETYPLDGILNTYDNGMDINSDFSKIYVAHTTSTDYNTWVNTGSIAVFDVATKQFETQSLAEGIEGHNGVQVMGEKVISYVSQSTTANGKAVFYSTTGQKISEHQTGISPIIMVKSK